MPFVWRLLCCVTFVRFFAFWLSETLAWASEQNRLPSTPPLELAVIVRCTRSRWTIRPSRLRSSRASVRLRIGQILCAESNFRRFATAATNACVEVAGARPAGLAVVGWKCDVAVPSATSFCPRRTNLLILSVTLTFPICCTPLAAEARVVSGARVPALVVEAATERAVTAATTETIKRWNHLRVMQTPLRLKAVWFPTRPA